jgi:hypothetical protein
MGVVDHY